MSRTVDETSHLYTSGSHNEERDANTPNRSVSPSRLLPVVSDYGSRATSLRHET